MTPYEKTITRDDLLFALNDASNQEQIVTCLLMSPLSGILMSAIGPIDNFTSLTMADLGIHQSLVGRIDNIIRNEDDADAEIDRDLLESVFAVGDPTTTITIPPTEAIKQIRTTDDLENRTTHYAIDLLNDDIMGFVIDLD